MLFKAYWRNSFYNFFQFHFENLPFTANLRWFVELWFTYVQPWKFNGQSGGDRLTFEFIKDNYLIYNDIYQLVLRRFCLCDFTNEENLQILSQILVVRVHLKTDFPLNLIANSLLFFKKDFCQSKRTNQKM